MKGAFLMEHKPAGSKKLKDLKKGDIIRTRIPFEENTRDYYNGYHPKEIRGEMYKDRKGDTSKPRFVIVIGHENNDVIYLPMTSQHEGYDSKHQYPLIDNSMTWKKDPDMKSWVELDSLRSVRMDPKWDIQYIGKLIDSDITNIMVQLGKRDIDFESKRDQRAYISIGKNERFERTLEENGYTLSKEQLTGKTYKHENGRTVTKSRWGLVKYHVPLSKEEVTEMIEKREGKPLNDFALAVADLTEKSNNKESETLL